jgi:hypothetical protein
MGMKSFIDYLNEATLKKPNVWQGLVSPRARKARKVYDERHSDDRKHKVKWRQRENKLNRDMDKLRGDAGITDINTPWTGGPTNAAT